MDTQTTNYQLHKVIGISLGGVHKKSYHTEREKELTGALFTLFMWCEEDIYLKFENVDGGKAVITNNNT